MIYNTNKLVVITIKAMSKQLIDAAMTPTTPSQGFVLSILNNENRHVIVCRPPCRGSHHKYKESH